MLSCFTHAKSLYEVFFPSLFFNFLLIDISSANAYKSCECRVHKKESARTTKVVKASLFHHFMFIFYL